MLQATLKPFLFNLLSVTLQNFGKNMSPKYPFVATTFFALSIFEIPRGQDDACGQLVEHSGCSNLTLSFCQHVAHMC